MTEHVHFDVEAVLAGYESLTLENFAEAQRLGLTPEERLLVDTQMRFLPATKAAFRVLLAMPNEGVPFNTMVQALASHIVNITVALAQNAPEFDESEVAGCVLALAAKRISELFEGRDGDFLKRSGSVSETRGGRA